MIKDELVLVACPPLSDYEKSPKDQSHCEPFDCPKCQEKMWLSDKKKGILAFSSCLNKEIILACYHCVTKMAQEDPSFFINSEMFDL